MEGDSTGTDEHCSQCPWRSLRGCIKWLASKKISFYDRNGNINEDSSEDSNKDSNSEEQQVLEIDPNSESYIDEPENHPGWLREIPSKVEADPEPETEATSAVRKQTEGLTIKVHVEENNQPTTE
jgi:hypothetical protein